MRLKNAITFLPTMLVWIVPLSAAGFNISLSFPPLACGATDSTLTIPEQDSSTVCDYSQESGKGIKQPLISEADYRIKTVVIDPGHGGHDPGCLGGHSREKHLALGISLELAAALRAQHPELNVILTRSTDVFIPLHERAAIANRNQADLFISIHCNYMPGSAATKGSETYVMGLHTAGHNLKVAKRENASILLEEDYEANYDYDPNSAEGHIMLSMFQSAYLEQSILFAEMVEQQFASNGRKSRGVKQAGFVVLKETTMPSVLVETGFLSNAIEEAFLMTPDGQKAIAGAMAQAFEQYRRAIEAAPEDQPLQAVPQAAPTALASVEQPVYPPTPKTAAAPQEPAPHQRQQLTARTPVNTPPPPPAPTPVSPSPKIITIRGTEAEPAKASPPPTAEKQPQQRPAPAPITFNVQLAASPRPIDTTHPKWDDTGYLIEVIQEGKLFKYQARNFLTLEEALIARKALEDKGFKGAFVVAYQGRERISLELARQIQSRP
ncbi:hypothetical protein FRY97_04640 [Phaeodactylibacter luteus]|uniref:N-acetylmuramoyl-L-alanine amidase n=2 Tax=Phaeodactylibacter luteus TaxID=1564516 RepID=A0A5C6RW88_9BACT|nr:hypothetical protein FRY97_04640 [Phaeodactylibacter luteus]